MKKVTREEFSQFLVEHPDLDRDVCGICEPPLINYNDFSTGQVWPESMRAKCKNWSNYEGREDEYWIVEDE